MRPNSEILLHSKNFANNDGAVIKKLKSTMNFEKSFYFKALQETTSLDYESNFNLE